MHLPRSRPISILILALSLTWLTAAGSTEQNPTKLPQFARQPTSKPKRIFSSGFEAGVTLGQPYNDGGGTWWQDLTGADANGSTWPMDVWGARGRFQVLVDSSLDPNAYIENKLEYTLGHYGTLSRALHMVQHQKAESFTQDPYIFYTNGQESGDLYLSYWMRLPANFASLLGADGWFAFLEWKTCCNEDRIAAYVYADLASQLSWYVQNDNETDGANPHTIYWDEENAAIPIPTGEWFHVEVFLHRSAGNDGRFWLDINGQRTLDHDGPNKHTENFDRFMPFTLYTSASQMDIWIDDVEIWRSLPR